MSWRIVQLVSFLVYQSPREIPSGFLSPTISLYPSSDYLLLIPWLDSLPTKLPTSTTSLDYSLQGYVGTVPTEFGLLTSATELNLCGNRLHGTLPTELGLMTALV